MNKTNPSFLIIKMSSLGDILQCFSVIDYLKRRFPLAQIDFVVEKAFAPLLRAHPQLRRVIVTDTKKWRKSIKTWREIGSFYRELRGEIYDVVIDLQGNCKSGVPTFLAKAKDKIGFASPPEWPNRFFTKTRFFIDEDKQINLQYLSILKKYYNDVSPCSFDGVDLMVEDDEKKKAESLLSSTHLSYPVRLMICPGSTWRNKRLREETLKEFLNILEAELNASFLFIWGNKEEELQANALQVRFLQKSISLGNLKIPTWQYLMARMDAVISMDSASLHLCATTKTPSFSFFGPSHAHIYRPLGEKHFAFQGKCPYGKVFVKRCPLLRTCETGACLRDLSPKILSKAFMAWWMGINTQNMSLVR